MDIFPLPNTRHAIEAIAVLKPDSVGCYSVFRKVEFIERFCEEKLMKTGIPIVL